MAIDKQWVDEFEGEYKNKLFDKASFKNVVSTPTCSNKNIRRPTKPVQIKVCVPPISAPKIPAKKANIIDDNENIL